MNLPPGSYELTVSDSWGDGMCCRWGEGSVSLTWPDGNWTSGRTFTGNQISKAFKIADNGGGGPPENHPAGPDLDRDGTVDELDDDIDGDGIRNWGDSDTLNDYEPVTVMYQGNGNPYFEIRKTGDALIGSSPEIASGDRVWLRKDQAYYCYLSDSQGGARITVIFGKYSVFVPIVDNEISHTSPLIGNATTRGAWINLSPVTVTWQSINREIEDWAVPDDYSDLITSTDPDYLGGLRYFPGGTLEDQQRFSNTVNVMVEVPFLYGHKIRIKAFDVDDPTPIPGVNDDIHGDDNRSWIGNFTGNVSLGKKIYHNWFDQSIIVELDEFSGTAIAEFQTSIQPGNNYRVVAYPVWIDNLALHVSGPVDAFYVGPDDDRRPALRHGGISRTLTIWRKLHLEYDSMTAYPEALYWSAQTGYGKVANVSDTPDRTTLSCNALFSNLPVDYFGNGDVWVLNDGSWRQPWLIWRSIPASGRYVCFREPLNAVTQGLQGKWMRIGEDDNKFLAYHNLPLPLPMNQKADWLTEQMAPEFALAYIQLIDLNAAGFNPNQLIPFSLRWHPGFLWWYPFDDSKDVTNRSSFWAHTVVFAYEPETYEDGDPDYESELRGVNLKGWSIKPHSIIFMEPIRDTVFNDGFLLGANREDYDQRIETRRQNYWKTTIGVTAHEIGHGPSKGESDDHDEGGLMAVWWDVELLERDFSAQTIKRFRSAHSWEEAQD